MTAAPKLLDELCLLTAQSLSPMETTEHFQLLKMLGEGSYGRVMLAVHKQRGTPMALKFFPRESTSLVSFLREYNLSLSFCSHPSLTRALGIAYSTPSHYVFAQQPSLFGDLYDVIIPEVGVEEELCQRVVSQLCGALSHLHSLGFVHRDLKPENVFLCDANCRWVKLGDFGMVKARGTSVPEVWYSSPYCPPEAEGARGVEGRGLWVRVEPCTDSWALGVLTFAMMTGAHPWAETASDCRSYQRYTQWFHAEGGRGHENLAERGRGQENPSAPVAPQFNGFTPLACSFFQTLLDPQPERRGRPQDMLGFLGSQWVSDVERRRLAEERRRLQAERKSQGVRSMKEEKRRLR